MNRTTVVVVKFDGELEFSRREEVREKFLSATNASSVLLDFYGVTYADSTTKAAGSDFAL
jgi:anti-anti-sigma regulatory factor